MLREPLVLRRVVCHVTKLVEDSSRQYGPRELRRRLRMPVAQPQRAEIHTRSTRAIAEREKSHTSDAKGRGHRGRPREKLTSALQVKLCQSRRRRQASVVLPI